MRNKKPDFSWDESEITEGELKYRLEEDNPDNLDEDEIREEIYNSDVYNSCWNDFKELLSEHLNKIDKHKKNYFFVSGEKLGWLNRSGEKVIFAKTGGELLEGILPKTDVTLQVYISKTQIKIICYHHDSPTGENYYIRCLNKKELKKEEEIY